MARNDRRYRRSGRGGRGGRYSGDSGKGKIVGIIICSVLGVLVVGMGIFELCSKGGFYSLFYSIANGKKTADITENAESVTLTQEQMMEDYEYMYHLLAENAPAGYLGNDIYGYSFSDDAIYQKGLAEVRKCQTPEEFYAAMRATTMRIPGSAAEAVFPLNTEIEEVIAGADSNQLETSLTPELYGYNNVIFRNMAKQGKDIKCEVKLVYVEGEYAVVENGKYNGIVQEIDGKDPVKFIADIFSSERITYDYQKKKAYVPEINLYKEEITSVALGVSVKFVQADGSDKKRDYYFDYAADMMVSCAELEDAKNAEAPNRINSTSHHVYTHVDEKNSIGYIRMKDFKKTDFDESHHDYNRVIFDEALAYDNIILDLRDCKGESEEYAAEIFFQKLFQNDCTVSGTYLLNSSGNTKIRNGNGLGAMLKEKLFGKKKSDQTGEDNKYYAISDRSLTYVGNKGHNKNVMILTSANTCEAAQTLVAAAKNSGQAYVLGSNTAGEGMSGYYVNACSNSRIVFTYCPYLELNPDNTVANVKGVAPTDYKSMNLDSLKKLVRQQQEDRDVESYENRIQWDNVLQNAISRMTGDEETFVDDEVIEQL